MVPSTYTKRAVRRFEYKLNKQFKRLSSDRQEVASSCYLGMAYPIIRGSTVRPYLAAELETDMT